MISRRTITHVISQLKTGWVLILISAQIACVHAIAVASEPTLVGFAKRDITPDQPLRLSGYSSRSKVMDGVRDRIFVRAISIGEDKQLCVMVSIEGIAVLAKQTEELLDAVAQVHSLDRSRLVVCSTHSHTAPQIPGGLTNLFREPISKEQNAALLRYREFVHRQCVEVVNESIANRQPSTVAIGSGQAEFAVHRRVIKGGTWTGFGVSPDGPTDRRVRVLVVRDGDNALKGAVFQYACHCTTLGPSFNEVTGDWAGLAASELETLHDEAIFLPVIGCGADANPEPRDSYLAAVDHGHEMAAAVKSVIESDSLKSIDAPPVARFGYAGISADTPSKEQLQAWLDDPNVNRARWARNMLETWNAKGRLPESYPTPIHTWTFGDQLAWIFIGGEVVVQYQMRLEEELEQFGDVWVAAYTDDVFAYIAAEQMRGPGGYEVDYSMVFYNQPGRWQSGTEDLIVSRIHQVLDSPTQNEGAKSPEQSLECMQVPTGFRIELIANEPLIVDPVNLAFAGDGSVWVVEMGDYPMGKDGGRVKRLTDTDGDGKLDSAELFLDGLEFPTSVLPWRDGAIVIAAPDIFFARDVDGDGQADERKVLLTGVGHANPQHRASGFDWGLDGMVYFGAGDTDQLGPPGAPGIAVHGADFRWNPDTGALVRLPGETQFIRSRDQWGRWFGNTNSIPLFHYPIDEYDFLIRSPSVPKRQLVLRPGVAPPVFPRSRTVDRFNDLFAKNRFTSACSSIIVRGTGLGEAMLDAALVCEPVHNLVARFKLSDDGPFITGQRFEADHNQDFITSTDTWSRPVRAIEAPDGSLWIVDMYRQVIEHPQWIPDAWQKRLNVRAGEYAGRIYRVSKSDADAWRAVNLESRSTAELIEALQTTNASLRDLACQQIIWRSPKDLRQQVLPLLDSADPAIRLQSFGLLYAANCETEEDWQRIFRDPHPHVVSWAIRHASHKNLTAQTPLIDFAQNASPENASVKLALLVALINSENQFTVGPLRAMVADLAGTNWAQDAMSLASPVNAPVVLRELLSWLAIQDAIEPVKWQNLQACIETLWKTCDVSTRLEIQRETLTNVAGELNTDQWMVLLVSARDDTPSERKDLLQAVNQVRAQMTDPDAPIDVRLRASQLLGSQLLPASEQLSAFRTMLSTDQPGAVREAALAAAYRINAKETAEALLAAWHELLPAERRTAGATLLQRRNWTRLLVDAMEQGKISINDLDTATLSGLQNYQDYSVMKRLGTLIAKPSPSQRRELVERYISIIEKEDVENHAGKQLFTEHCSVCHRQALAHTVETAASIGPPLANLKSWSVRQWVTAVLDPNANVESKYKQYKVLTKSGQIFSGVVQEQQDLSLKLALPDGKIINVDRSEIEQLSDTRTSMMPEGFESKLQPQDVAAIIAYLRAQ